MSIRAVLDLCIFITWVLLVPLLVRPDNAAHLVIATVGTLLLATMIAWRYLHGEYDNE
jgi:hypothetical protein